MTAAAWTVTRLRSDAEQREYENCWRIYAKFFVDAARKRCLGEPHHVSGK